MNDVYRYQQRFDQPITATIVFENGGRAIYKDSRFPTRIIYSNGEEVRFVRPDSMDSTAQVLCVKTDWFSRLANWLVKIVLLVVIRPTQIDGIDIVGAVLNVVMDKR